MTHKFLGENFVKKVNHKKKFSKQNTTCDTHFSILESMELTSKFHRNLVNFQR